MKLVTTAIQVITNLRIQLLKLFENVIFLNNTNIMMSISCIHTIYHGGVYQIPFICLNVCVTDF